MNAGQDPCLLAGAPRQRSAGDIISVMTKQVRKPVKRGSSAKRDLNAMPQDVEDVFDHAIALAQADAKQDFDAWATQQGVRK